MKWKRTIFACALLLTLLNEANSTGGKGKEVMGQGSSEANQQWGVPQVPLLEGYPIKHEQLNIGHYLGDAYGYFGVQRDPGLPLTNQDPTYQLPPLPQSLFPMDQYHPTLDNIHGNAINTGTQVNSQDHTHLLPLPKSLLPMDQYHPTSDNIHGNAINTGPYQEWNVLQDTGGSQSNQPLQQPPIPGYLHQNSWQRHLQQAQDSYGHFGLPPHPGLPPNARGPSQVDSLTQPLAQMDKDHPTLHSTRKKSSKKASKKKAIKTEYNDELNGNQDTGGSHQAHSQHDLQQARYPQGHIYLQSDPETNKDFYVFQGRQGHVATAKHLPNDPVDHEPFNTDGSHSNQPSQPQPILGYQNPAYLPYHLPQAQPNSTWNAASHMLEEYNDELNGNQDTGGSHSYPASEHRHVRDYQNPSYLLHHLSEAQENSRWHPAPHYNQGIPINPQDSLQHHLLNQGVVYGTPVHDLAPGGHAYLQSDSGSQLNTQGPSQHHPSNEDVLYGKPFVRHPQTIPANVLRDSRTRRNQNIASPSQHPVKNP